MSLFSQFPNRILGWWHDVPIPPHETDATPTFQAWHRYDPLTTKWDPASSGTSAETDPGKDENAFKDSRFVLATWNVDAAAPAPEARISALISYFQNMDGQPDIIFLQEISHPALSRLLELPWIRKFWYSSEADATNWGTRPFTNITLISKERFNLKPNPATKKNDMAGLDRVWRVKYPSRFGRDALCCDILLPSTSPSSPDTGPTRETKTEPSRIRLINVHLDSLPVNPSLRPRQYTISASYLRAAGHGVIAGDFNPVLPEDETLIGDNHLVDAWSELYPDKDGFTWGVNGDAPFPPGRLDRVATLGLKSCSMKVAQPGECTERIMVGQKGKQGQDYEEVTVPWTDHSGLVYEFEL